LQVEPTIPTSTPPPLPRYISVVGGKEKADMAERFAHIAGKLRMRKEKDEVRLTVEEEVDKEVDNREKVEEELNMSHQEIAVWIDCQARWLFPVTFAAWVTFYFLSIHHHWMDYIFSIPGPYLSLVA